MIKETGWRYGVDGFPYLLGCGAVAIGSTGVGGAGIVRRRAARRAAWGAVLAGAAASVPTILGLRYVTSGKIALRDRMLEAVRWRGEEEVADLGAGLGLLSIGAAQRTEGNVHCVDLFITKDLLGNSPEGLMKNARRAKVQDRIKIRREDVRNVGLVDGSVDVVLSALCFHNLDDADDRSAAVKEAMRIVRPDGTIVISDLSNVDEYAVTLRQGGFDVRSEGRVHNTFPPQRMLVARRA